MSQAVYAPLLEIKGCQSPQMPANQTQNSLIGRRELLEPVAYCDTGRP
nr:hypothetical protein [Kibdelosporangium sp. MJ126-NF4]